MNVRWRRYRYATVALMITLAIGCDRKAPQPSDTGATTNKVTSSRPSQTAPPQPASRSAESLPVTTAPTPPELSRPESVPATAPAVAPFIPLKDAVVGEWARYQALDTRVLEYRIESIAQNVVGVRVTAYEQGKPVGQPALRSERQDFDPLAEQAGRTKAHRKSAPEAIEAAGRKWNALLYEDRWIDEGISYIRRTWVSADAPVWGTIRMELHGDGKLEARLELTAFGWP